MKSYRGQVGKYIQTRSTLGEVLRQMSGQQDLLLQQAATFGAVWLQRRGKGKILRERSLETVVAKEDVLSFYLDPRILKMPELERADCIFENDHYGVWIKAAGVVPQGTQWGDHTSLLRFVEKHRQQDVYLIHRLDRETVGLMIIGHHANAAARLTSLFTENKIQKIYQAVVLGEMPLGSKSTIDVPLDGKTAITHFEVLQSHGGKSLLEVKIQTGRLHQIRQHLTSIGHPVMGDPKYGQGNKNRKGLQLMARELIFSDPWTHSLRKFQLPDQLTI